MKNMSMGRLSEFKKGDLVLSRFSGKTYEIIKDNTDIFKLRDINTGYISELNSVNNHGFSKVEKGQQLNLL